MEIDLFEHEQQIYDSAVKEAVGYAALVKEYGKLLKQLRRATRIADKTTSGLHTHNLDLADKVHYDALTGIYNRRYMEENLKRLLNTLARSSNDHLSVLMLDVDCFKKYNDNYGHSDGDTCLKIIADVLTACISRADDFVARYGGEEFIVVLPNTNEHGAAKIAHRIINSVMERNIPHEKSDVANVVTVSVGGTTGTVKHTQSGTDYIKYADAALYMSKQAGRNRYTYIHFKEERL